MQTPRDDKDKVTFTPEHLEPTQLRKVIEKITIEDVIVFMKNKTKKPLISTEVEILRKSHD